jgi:hypothetical protein
VIATKWKRTHKKDMARIKRTDIAVKLDVNVAKLARIVAAARGIPFAEYISQTLKPIVERDAKEVGASLTRKPDALPKPEK